MLQVYKDLPRLQASKTQPRVEITSSPDGPMSHRYGFAHNWAHLKNVSAQSLCDFNSYFHHSAFLPSFSGALLYLTVLSFAGQMVTYLLSVGYTSTSIGVARTLAVALEVAATWVAPLLVGRIGPVRTGLWGLTWQMTCLGVGTALCFAKAQDQPLISASGLVIGVMLSRLGLRGFDLSAQLIVQEEVEPEMRGAFSSVESAWQNGFELVSYASTIVFSRPDQFRWPTLLSVVAVCLAGALFAAFVRMRRGHLFHLQHISSCVTGDIKKGDGQEQEQDGTFASYNVHSMVC
jgi:iron-regulated transporter 1